MTVRLEGEFVKGGPEGQVGQVADVKAVPVDRDRVVVAPGGKAADKAGPVDSVVQKPCDSFPSPEPSTTIRTERFPPMRSPMRRRFFSHSTKTVTAS